MSIFAYFARRYPWESAAVLLCLVVAHGLEMIGLSVVIPAVSMVTGQESDPGASGFEVRVRETMTDLGIVGAGPLLGVVAAAFWFKAVTMLVAKARVGYAVAHVATDLRLRLLRSLLRTSWSYYTHQPVGAVANAIATEAQRASHTFWYATLITTSVLEVVIYSTVALGVSWKAVVAAAAVGSLIIGVLHALVAMGGRAGLRQTRVLKSLLGRLTDMLQSVKLLKTTGRENLVGPLLEEDTQRLNKALRKQVLSKESVRSIQEPILVSSICAGVFLATQVMDMVISSLTFLIFAFVRIVTSVNKGQRRYQNMSIEASALWSLEHMISAAEAAREPEGGMRVPTLDRELALRGVRVEYDGQPVLDDVNLELPAGTIIGIVGASGAGKTTVLDLLSGLVRPTKGEVSVDGIPLTELDLRRWRRMIGYVPQEMLLLHDTVERNVTLGDPALGPEDAERALREVGAWEFVAKLPEGMSSSVGERGTLLSGGQRQRIAIARAIVHRPALLVLDEATAALDPDSEAGVWDAVARLRGKTTVVAVSHQPAMAGVADRLYRLSDARSERLAATGARPARGRP